MSIIDWNVTHRAGHALVVWFIGWLRKDRWFASDPEALLSWWQYSEVASGRYGTSILGIINGYLPRLGFVLVCHFKPGDTEGAGEPQWPYLTIRRRWWAL